MTLAAVLWGSAMTSCENTLEADLVDEGRYETAGEVYGYLRDMQTGRPELTLEIHDGETLSQELYLGLTRAADKGVDVTLKVDVDYLTRYNQAHGTSFELYPSLDLVSFEEQGAIVIAPGDLKSDVLTVEISKDNKVEEGKTYLLPIVAEMKTDGIKLSSDATHFAFLVRGMGAQPNTSKGSVKTVVFIATNDTNPLNVLEFNMKQSGKPFFDIVVLFAANIKYKSETGRAHVYFNAQQQFLMDNYDQYIRPLQKRGMKVLLGILPDHDRAGVTQLADDTARDFANEVRAVCEIYGLDGVNLDDEYNGAPIGPGFITSSRAAGARLCYELKRQMPDKLVSVYAYNNLKNLSSVFDGMQPGDYVDFAVPDYNGKKVVPSDFPGMSMSQCGNHSLELRANNSTTVELMRQMRADGYGYQMSFSLYPANYRYNVPELNNVAIGLFDDELVPPQYYYEMESTQKTKAKY